SDPGRPFVLRNCYGAPHQWFDEQIPGCRAGGGDNPDNDYSYFPIDGYSNYLLSGRVSSNPIVDAPITASGNVSQTMPTGGIDWSNVVVGETGEFQVTIGPEPAGGRSNHLQTTLDSVCVFMRDCRSDWNQIPNSYSIERLDGLLRPELNDNQIATRASQYMIDSIPTMYWWLRVMDSLEANTTPLVDIASMGGLVSQQLSLLRLKIAEDEAFIIKTGMSDAKYHSVVLSDYWFRTFDYWNSTSTLNNGQSMADGDGVRTYVVSHEDSGTQNWLDTRGFKELLVCVRWQGMTGSAVDAPWISGELVKLDDLTEKLPDEVGRVAAIDRAGQFECRREQFLRRFEV
ncbi:MAG: hypothetical protein RID07_00420, partial [Lacipirellulaceae bacterium]